MMTLFYNYFYQIMSCPERPNNVQNESFLIVDPQYGHQTAEFLKKGFQFDDLEHLIQDIDSSDIILQHRGIIGISELLRQQQSQPLRKRIVNMNIVPKLMAFANQDKFPQLQHDAIWSLVNITAAKGRECAEVVKNGGIHLFLNLLKSNNNIIVEQAIWGTSNISASSVRNRDEIIRRSGLSQIIEIGKRYLECNKLLSLCCWAIANFGRGNPLPNYRQICEGVEFLCSVIIEDKINEEDVLRDCYSIFYCYSDEIFKKGKRGEEIICQLIKKNLSYNFTDPSVMELALIIIKGYLQLNSEKVGNTLAFGCLKVLVIALKSKNGKLKAEACALLQSIIKMGSPIEINTVISQKELIQRLVQLSNVKGQNLKQQIYQVFFQLASKGEEEVVFTLYYEHKIISFIYRMLQRCLTLFRLELLERMLGFAARLTKSKHNAFTKQLMQLGIMEQLEKFQCKMEDTIVDCALRIISYFQ